MNDNIPTSQKRGFTLVELLVVIGIIAILMGILMPVIVKARAGGARVACRAQMADIGRLFQMYLNSNKEYLPYIDPQPGRPLMPPRPSLVAVLANVDKVEDATDGTKVWRCPADVITEFSASYLIGFDTYYDVDGSSYLYELRLMDMAGERWQQLFARRGASEVMVMTEREPFHGRAGTPGAMNKLFADWHVADE